MSKGAVHTLAAVPCLEVAAHSGFDLAISVHCAWLLLLDDGFGSCKDTEQVPQLT